MNPSPTQIRAARLTAGLTQAAFGELIEASVRTVQDWESGRRNMPSVKWKWAQIQLVELQAHKKLRPV